MELDDILNVLATTTDDERVEAIRDAVRAAAENGADMPGLEAAAVDRFRELREEAEDSTPNDDQLTALEFLVDVVEHLREYNVGTQQRAEEAHRRLASLAGRVVTEDGADEGENTFADDSSSDDDADEDQGEETADDGGSDTSSSSGKKKPAKKTASVSTSRALATQQERRLPLNFLRSKSAVPAGRGSGRMATGDDRSVRYTVTSADVPGISARQKIGDLSHLATVVNTRMQSMVRSATSGRAGIATITRHVAAKYSISQEMDIDGAIKAAADEFSLPGGNLVAAGAWCAPPDTLWDLCPDDSGNDGFLDLPTVTTRRSGIRFPQAFDFSPLYGGVGFHFGKDQLHWSDCEEGPDGQKKCCIEIPCPEWTECLLELDGICIRNSILMERGWPEWTSDFTARVLKAHRRRMNAWTIAKIESLATQISMPQVNLPATGIDVAGLHGPGAVESVLSILEMMVEYQRYRYRLPRAATLEAVMPYWLLPILRADLSKKSGWNLNRWNVTDQQLIQFLQSRGVRVQFVYDWQDAFAAAFQPNPGDCGDAEAAQGKAKYPHSPGVYDCCECTEPDPDNPCGSKPRRSANEGRVLPASSCCAAGVYEGGDCCDAKFKCLRPLQLGCDTFGGSNAGPLFGGLPPTHWPTHVKILLYPAGSVFKLQQDVITLEGIYDHASLMENKYTSLFTEEGTQVCKRCYDPYLLDIPLCPNGLSGGPVVTGCKPSGCTPGYGASDCNDCNQAFTNAEKAFADKQKAELGFRPCDTGGTPTPPAPSPGGGTTPPPSGGAGVRGGRK
ncbi:major capsid protein [Streptomyces violaceusniger]|uniref:major capsid protein n=1 Tax=Streptomyces violaceusniger TaxID=68280 RepID=UPI0002E767D7|nr:major capsid protein [Streptomyces violaceusniger]